MPTGTSGLKLRKPQQILATAALLSAAFLPAQTTHQPPAAKQPAANEPAVKEPAAKIEDRWEPAGRFIFDGRSSDGKTMLAMNSWRRPGAPIVGHTTGTFPSEQAAQKELELSGPQGRSDGRTALQGRVRVVVESCASPLVPTMATLAF